MAIFSIGLKFGITIVILIKVEKIEIMKNMFKITGALIIMFMLSSCIVHDHGRGPKKIPPGQAKKVFGGSAKITLPDR